MIRIWHLTLYIQKICPFSSLLVTDGTTNLLLGNHTNMLLVYQDVTLKWAAQLPFVPVAIRTANFPWVPRLAKRTTTPSIAGRRLANHATPCGGQPPLSCLTTAAHFSKWNFALKSFIFQEKAKWHTWTTLEIVCQCLIFRCSHTLRHAFT